MVGSYPIISGVRPRAATNLSIKFIINTSSDYRIVDQAEIAYENIIKLAQILERILTTDNVVRNNVASQ